MRHLILLLTAAAFLAAPHALRAGDDKKKEEEKENRKGGKKEEEKAREEEQKKKEMAGKAEECDWDDREGDHACPWPDRPDIDEMMEGAKREAGHAAAPPPAEGEGPGVGGFRKPDAVTEQDVAEAVGNEFGEGTGEDSSWLDK